MRNLVRWTKIIGAWLLFAVLTPALAAGAFLGSAKLTSSVAGLAAASLLTAMAVSYGTARLGLLAVGARQQRRWNVGLMAGATIILVGLGWALLFRRPPYEVNPMPERIAAFEKMRLSTGSNVAVARIPAASSGPALKVPLVFLHGGPGAYVRDTDLEMLRAIAAQGVEVVTFDQAGGGLSDRLGVREYSLARAVADLDALREELGTDRISIMGHSWGSMLAFEYAVAHPDRVDSLVLTSGGLLSQRAQKFTLERTAAAELGQPKFPVYFMATALLHGVNPDAAVAFTPRDELDATWRKAAAGNIARWYCKEDAASVPSEDLFGKMPAFDAYQTLALRSAMTGRAEPPAPPSVLPRTLILRGACDFIPWIAARDLRDRLEATLISIPGVGHAIWPKEADLVVKLTVEHLKGSSFEKMAYRGAEDPAATASRR